MQLTQNQIWLIIGFAGQAMFTGRFLVQWLATERAKKSVVPLAFWYFSLAGGMTLLAYAIYKRDPVFILGQATGTFIYLRNLYFIRQGKMQVND
jgi:lipid-A-disaccharide synthase-like uncharacterized protein